MDLQAAKRKDPLRGKGGVRMIRRMDADSWTGLVLACMVMLCYRAALRSGDLTGSLVAGDIIWEDDLRGFTVMLDRTETHRCGEPIYVRVRGKVGAEVDTVALMRRRFNTSGMWDNHTRRLFSTWMRGREVCAVGSWEEDISIPLEYSNVAGYTVHWVRSVGESTASLAGKISQLKTYFSLMGEPWLSEGDAGKLAQMVKDLEYLEVFQGEQVIPASAEILVPKYRAVSRCH